jgi:OCT family organic cation transporter-like MFS transporter 4/5
MAGWRQESQNLLADPDLIKDKRTVVETMKDGEAGGEKPAELEDVLEEHVGRAGCFQAWLLTILFFCQATMAPGVYSAVFTDYTPRHHCATAATGDTFNLTVWKEEGSQCGDGNCSSWAFDQSVFRSTASSDFSIVCDSAILKDLSNTLRMSGLLVGSFFFGWLSDMHGRLVSITAAGILLVVSQILAGFSNSYVMFSVLNIGMAAGGIGSYLVSFVMLFEWTCPAYRTKASVFAQVPFAVGFLYVVFLSWCFRSSWRTLQWVIALPNLLFLLFPFVLPESPRWLVSRGEGARALASIATAARSNGRRLPDNLVIKEVEEGEEQGIGALAHQPRLRFRLFIMSLNWIVITLCFYGLSMNSAGQDLFIGLGTMAGVELVAYLATMVFMDTLGRQPILSVCQVVAGISCICAGCIPVSYFWLRLCLALIGKAGASAGFAVVFVYTAEMFPTPIRNSAVGLCSTVARVGALLAPGIAGLDSVWAPLPFLIMGGAAILVGSLSCLLPETRGAALPETVEEAAALESGATCCCGTQTTD